MSQRLEADARLVDALRLTGNPPPAWIYAAALIPVTLGDLGSIERLVASPEFRSRFLDSPLAAVEDVGLPATPALVSALRAELV
jgi:hypothetical protein